MSGRLPFCGDELSPLRLCIGRRPAKNQRRALRSGAARGRIARIRTHSELEGGGVNFTRFA